MDRANHTRGAQNEITTHDQPIVYDGRAAELPPPLTFEEAEQHNAFQLLTELHDHAMALRLHDKPPTFHLTELALSAAVVAWWSRWQPIAIHRAFVAGASLSDVAAATGTDDTAVYQRWAAWADEQVQLVIAGQPAIDPDEVATVRNRLAGMT